MPGTGPSVQSRRPRHTGRAALRGSTTGAEARMTAGLEHTWVAHYAKGVPAEIEPPDSSLVDLLTGSVTTYADRPALEFFGVLRLGAVVLEHRPLYTPTEVAHQFGDHGATVAIEWDRMATTITALP